MEPATSILRVFGEGDQARREVADLCGVHPSATYRWTYSRERGGTGGTIPQRYHGQLIEAANARGWCLRFEHFAPNQTPRISRARMRII